MTGRIDPRRLTTVYRLYDQAGRLLYVGTSVDPRVRWEQHARSKLWWSAVTRATVVWHPTRTDALAAERHAIRTEGPLHNDKATDKEEVYPYQGNRGPTMETILRRAATEHRNALDRLAIAADRAALAGLSIDEIADKLSVSGLDVESLAERFTAGGGVSALADRIDKERASPQPADN